MPRSSPFQGDFLAGEISPLAYGKVQEERYKKGLARCFNEIPTLEGALYRRPGTNIVTPTISTDTFKIYPFKFSGTSAVLLQFGPLTITFYTSAGQVQSGGFPVTVATPYLPADLPLLDFTQYKNSLYIACPNKPVQRLDFVNLTTWSLSTLKPKDGPYSGTIYHNINTTDSRANGPQLLAQASGSYTGGTTTFPTGGTVFRVPNVAPQSISSSSGQAVISHLGELSYLKENDTVYVSGTSVTAANGDWTVTNVNKNSFTLKGSSYGGATVASPGGNVLDTSFVKNNIPSGGLFSSVSNFRFLLQSASTMWFYGPVTQLGNVGGRVYDFYVNQGITGITSATPTLAYRAPAWGAMADGTPRYPSCVTFHENRLVFGNSSQSLIHGSYVGDYENFAPSDFAANSTTDNTVITDACSYSFAFLSGQVDSVNWLVSDEKGLIVGTTGVPWVVKPSTLNQALTPTNISAKKTSGYTTGNTRPVVVGKSVIHLDPSTRVVRDLAYFFSIEGFRSVDLTEFYSHLTSKGISTRLVYQNVPLSNIWCARSDGALLGITYDRTQDELRMGWHQHLLGGKSDAAGTPPIIEDLAVMPSVDGTCDDVWMVVKRYSSAYGVYRSLEYMSKVFESFNRLEAAPFLDCAITLDTPVDVQNATKGAVTTFAATAHGLVTGDHVRLRDIAGLAFAVGGYSPLNDVLFTVTVIDSSHFSVPYDSTSLTSFIVTDAINLGLPGRTQFRKMNTVITHALLPLFEGETFDVFGDGADLGSYTVTSGQITLSGVGAGQIRMGYGYSSEIKQLRLEAGSADGTSIGKVRRINEAAFMLDRSGVFEYGSSFDSMYPVTLRQVSDSVNEEAPLFSGISDNNNVDFGYDTENQLCIRQNRPLPLTLLAILPQQVTHDKR